MEKEHLSKHYEAQIHLLKEKILTMGAWVEAAIAQAIKALKERDSATAEHVIREDRKVDELEREIDELCLELLALRQPMARDLRFVATALKIVKDLERIGDEAVNISERALELNLEPELKPLIDIPIMAQAAQKMLRDSLDAYVQEDAELAGKVCAADDYVDQLYEQLFRELLTYMIEDPRNIGRASRLIFVSKCLERIADHASNLAEMVILMVQGRDIRHGHYQ